MSHPLVELAASCLVETSEGLVLAGRVRLERAVDEWAERPDARDAIAELVRFAVYVDERWSATDPASEMLSIACRATPLLRPVSDENRNPIAHRAPRIDEPGRHGTLPVFALLQHRSKRRRA